MANAAENESIGSASRPCGDRNEFAEEGYWTAERRARARPARTPKLPMPKAGGDEQPATTAEALPKGPPGHIPGHAPPGWSEEIKLASALEPGYGIPQVATEVPDPLNYPYSTVGKLFYTFPDGSDGEGSAAMILPHIALTAGHCIYDKAKGGKATKVVFNPGFNYRKAPTQKEDGDPLYEFNCSHLVWETAWARDKNFAYDYAMVWLDRDATKLGWLGLVWNQSPKGRYWTAVGYPAPNSISGGVYMYRSRGQLAPSQKGDLPGTFGLTNDDMGIGSSGGPWITEPPYTDLDDTWPYHANGVESRGTGPGPGTPSSTSPYFTHAVWDMVLYISKLANRVPYGPFFPFKKWPPDWSELHQRPRG